MLLPLFPLEIVLFPGTLIPLHIFEPRYQQLLSDVSSGDRRFGIVPPGSTAELPEPGAIGSLALIRAVLPLPEGRANIVVSGERRIRLVEEVGGATPYYRGLVEWVDDLPDIQVPSGRDLRQLHLLGERLALAQRAIADQALEVSLPPGAAELSFEIAALLAWDFRERQRFLEIRSATERVERLLHVLPLLVEQAEARALVHGRAKHNGRSSIS